MVLTMPRPTKNKATGVYVFRQRVPAHAAEILRGKSVTVPIAGKTHHLRVGAQLKVSLGTKDRGEALERAREAQDGFDLIWATYTEAPIRLPHRLCVALSGEIYRFFKDTFEDDPHLAKGWSEAHRARQAEDARRAAPLKTLMIVGHPVVPGSPADILHLAANEYLADHHLNVDAESYQRLMAQINMAYGDVLALLDRQAAGDYSPDTTVGRFPPIETPRQAARKPSGQARAVSRKSGDALDLLTLLDHKARTQSLKQDTVTKYRGKLDHFIKFSGQDNAATITKNHVRDWRDSLVASGLAKKTVNDQYLAALKATLNHGLKEFNLATNVADKLRDERDAPAPTGSKGYSLAQAKVILEATFRGSTKDLAIPYKRAVFWVPWICAYTGLRVTEVAQLQGRNLREDDGVPYLLITPEDGSTKGKNAWTTGIHAHLIELGLLDMLREVGNGPAFYVPYPEGTDLKSLPTHRAKNAGDKIAEWIKCELGIVAPGNKPSHAWRHAFTTLSRSHQIDKETRDYMLGSRSTTDAREGYGDWPPAVIDAAVNRLPRFDVEDTGWRPTVAQVPPLPLGAPSNSRARSVSPPRRSSRKPRKT